MGGSKRKGRRISGAVDAAVTAAIELGRIVRDGDFLFDPNQTSIAPRNRSQLDSSNLRQPEMLPPSEIRAAIESVVRAHLGASADDTVVEAARMFGFRSTSPQLRELIEEQIQSMRNSGELTDRNGTLYANSNEPRTSK